MGACRPALQRDRPWRVDCPWRIKACELGTELGRMIMVHIADPDTWFATLEGLGRAAVRRRLLINSTSG